MIAECNAVLDKEDAFSVANHLSARCGLLAMFKLDNSVESQSRAANVEELLNSVKGFVEDRQNQYREELLADSDIDDVDSIAESEIPVVTLSDFLEDISLLSAVDMADEDASNKITLMTVHSSKGLEFPYVYVSGMEENIFPSGGMFSDPSQIEEERRLFYVALTRAKVAVNLSFATTRMRNGKHEQNSPSRFVKEIDSQYIDNPLRDDEVGESENVFSRFGFKFGRQSLSGYGGNRNESGNGSREYGRSSGYQSNRGAGSSNHYGTSGEVKVERTVPKSSVTGRPLKPVASQQPSAFPRAFTPRTPDSEFPATSVLDIKAGQRVEHNRFGYGVVKEISGGNADLKAKILFDEAGEKILLLKYAKIRVVE